MPAKSNWIIRFLKGTYNHYSLELPEKPGFLTGFFLKRFFSGISIEKEQVAVLNNLPEDAIIVYVAKQKSRFQYLLYYTRYRQLGLPYPTLGFYYSIFFLQPVLRLVRIMLAGTLRLSKKRELLSPLDNGYLAGELKKGKTAFLSLVSKRDFRRRFVKSATDPLEFLLRLQRDLHRPVCLVPQLVFFGREPLPAMPSLVDIFFGPEQNPGKLRRLVALFKNPGKSFIEVTDPVNLQEFLAGLSPRGISTGHAARMLRRHLLTQMNQHRRAITGPVLRTDTELKQNILIGDDIQAYMRKYAERRDKSRYWVHAEALAYLDEIAAKPNPAVIKGGATVVQWLLNSMFEGVSINTQALNSIKSHARKGPIIFIPCHKSHLDSLLVAHILYRNNLPAPLFFAGRNLTFWPIGVIFRRLGAFFVRRSVKAVFYAKVLSEYIRKIIANGHNIGVFIEGTRSRSGKLYAPQLGMLTILLNAVKRGACEDLSFVPVFIGYDRVPEEQAYLSEVEGHTKPAESLEQMVKARKILKKRYGRIYVNFHEPFLLSDLLTAQDLTVAKLAGKQQNLFCRYLGHRILSAINTDSVATPHALVACAILHSDTQVSQEELDFRTEAGLAHLTSRRSHFSDTLVSNPDSALNNSIVDCIKRKIIDPQGLEGENQATATSYRINPKKRTELDYYKNTVINLFIPAAFTALLIRAKDAFQFSAANLHENYAFLQDLFINEFTPDPDRPPAFLVRKTVKAFIDDAIIIPHPTLPDTYNITSSGYKKLVFFAGLLKPFFESYLVALDYLDSVAEESRDRKKTVKKIRSLGQKMFKHGDITRRESLSVLYYTNAVDSYAKNGLKGPRGAEKLSRYNNHITRYLTILSAG
jgi:glycerol-3-phosphate O-acyltransferase